MDMDSILMIIGIVVLFGIAGGCVFGVIKLRGLLNTFDTKVDPQLDDLKAKVSGLKPVAEQSGPLMESVNVALDSLNVEMVNLDGKLEELKDLTGKVVGVGEAAKEAKTAITAGLAGKR